MLSDVQERYSLTWRVTPDLLGILGASGYFEATNPAWMVTLGYTAEEVESRLFFDFVHEDDHPRTHQAFVDIQRGLPILQFENRYRHKNGTYRWLSWNCVPEGGKFYCSARDITESKNNAAALKTREEEALLREQFIAVLGHDLRNPLAAITAGTRLLSREELSERGRFCLKEISDSAARAGRLVDNVLDFARGRLGEGLVLERNDRELLTPVLEQVVSEVRATEPDRVIEARFDIREPIDCDQQRLGQLAANLISNAVTYGEPKLPIVVEAYSTNESFVFSVTNSGPAISEEARAQLFQPFFRGGARPNQHGLGLGLFIVNEIATAHGGTMEVESDDAFTRFRFSMPQPDSKTTN
ncbi:PAS domain-containing sensor histidine kinase [Pseudooceanicola atlanticus]|jgi:PAS domain S-box-containing protein|uniref:PAS domain-containing sensor histidine kinase n=1 Tax=Pseudooceanicola atlanticus TaxID=1461694 RepID=UPI0023540CF5|nr:PAS domain-containing sensor histidine kinase [Pseudooceanicola atlanticus]